MTLCGTTTTETETETKTETETETAPQMNESIVIGTQAGKGDYSHTPN